MARAPDSNGSVQMAMVGIPRCSSWIESCTLHDEQLPQSPFAVIITSTSLAMPSSTSGAAGLLASPLLTATRPPSSKRSIEFVVGEQANHSTIQSVRTSGHSLLDNCWLPRGIQHAQFRVSCHLRLHKLRTVSQI